MSDRRTLERVLLLSLVACTRQPSANEATSRTSSAPPPVDASVEAAAVFRGPHATSPIAWAFWTRDGALLAASKTDLWKLETACSPPTRVPVAIDALFATGGVDAFVVERASAFELWNAGGMRAVGPIAHPAHGRGGAVAAVGGRIALGGCAEIAADPKLVTSCGELYDAATGGHTAGFVAKHGFSELAFSNDGKYLVARGDTRALSVIDATTGKVLVSRPSWSRMQEVHAWNRPDVAEIVGDALVVSYDDTVEHVDLGTGKTLGKIVTPNKTLAVFGRRTLRVAVFQGEAARARIWDVTTHATVRTFDLAKHVAPGANCRHCALEFDEVDEDRVWLTSAYTNDRLEMRIGSGEVKHVDAHLLRSESQPSATHRLEEHYDFQTRRSTCTLDRRDRDAPPATLPSDYCNRVDTGVVDHGGFWPYPGFDPHGRFLAAVHGATLRVWDIERARTVCVAGPP